MHRLFVIILSFIFISTGYADDRGTLRRAHAAIDDAVA